MADKKQNEILAEQKRAREEFLKLKKMQSGELDAGPKPSEVEVLPKTFKEKAANFWFHYKWLTIGLTVTVVLLAFLVAQCCSKPKYDLEIVYYTETPIFELQIEAVENYFKEYATDVNGDGEINIQIIDCSFPENDADLQYKNANIQKLQSLIIANEKAMLYITDESKYSFFEETFGKGEAFFVNEPYALSDEFYEKTKTDSLGNIRGKLSISCRKIEGTMLEKNKNSKIYYEESLKLLEALKN